MRKPLHRSGVRLRQGTRHGLARVLSKLGYCSRAQAWELIRNARVRLNGAVCRNPESPVNLKGDKIEVDGRPIRDEGKCYLMLNKPRGLVTTRSDEQGRPTVYDCFGDSALPWLAPVGRLDRASEGLLLFTNDTAWADRIAAPDSHVEKRYHVQIGGMADEVFLQKLRNGVVENGEELLTLKGVQILRQGTRNSWLEIVLDEGKNRHIRRLLAALDVPVLRLIRVAIGSLELGSLGKGQYRPLTREEIQGLVPKQLSP
jgi:23S rRNA pseudouridine2605 synthase